MIAIYVRLDCNYKTIAVSEKVMVMGHLKTLVHLENRKTIAVPQKGNLQRQVLSALHTVPVLVVSRCCIFSCFLCTALCPCWWSQDGGLIADWPFCFN